MLNFKRQSMPYAFSDKTPGIFSVNQLDEIDTFVSIKTKEIEESKNPRLIILETWFIVDWLVRQLIISGINCLDLKTDEYTPHYQLLPNSFRESVDCLKKLIDNQNRLQPKPINNKACLRGSIELWEYIKKESPNTFKKIGELEKEFQRSKYNIPRDSEFYIGDKVFEKGKYRFVSEEWLLSVSKIDTKWFEKAEKLNNARNLAAHAFDECNLFKPFGIKGQNKINKLRNECLNLLSIIAGLSKEKP